MESYIRNIYKCLVVNAHNNSIDYFSQWEKAQHAVPQVSVLGPLLFLTYVNDISKIVSDKSSPFLFAEDTRFFIGNRDETEFEFNTNEIFSELYKCFHSNFLMLNCEKKNFLYFLTKPDHEIMSNVQVSFVNRKIATTQCLKFLELTVDTSLTWKHHIGELTSRLVMP
jgi:hypothetical protein